jgi:hypothetical protein
MLLHHGDLGSDLVQLGLDLRDEQPHGRLRDLRAVVLGQPLPHPTGGVPLLDRHPIGDVGLDPAPRQLAPRTHRRGVADRRLARHRDR